METEFSSYKNMIKRFVEAGGNVTAEGIGHIYALSSDLGLSGEWLNRYVEGRINEKINNMSY